MLNWLLFGYWSLYLTHYNEYWPLHAGMGLQEDRHETALMLITLKKQIFDWKTESHNFCHVFYKTKTYDNLELVTWFQYCCIHLSRVFCLLWNLISFEHTQCVLQHKWLIGTPFFNIFLTMKRWPWKGYFWYNLQQLGNSLKF